MSFKTALQTQSLAVIAEIKRRSPSKGNLAAITNPIALAQKYILGGANALSILTDENFFHGHIEDLSTIAHAIKSQPIPIIRKDFIIDKLQIAEAAIAGASAILLIVAAIGKKIQELSAYAHTLNLDVLTEVHNYDELQLALDCGANIIGINNRDLQTFAIDTQRALQLITKIPKNIITVAESGITSAKLAQEYYQAGFNAVLIGEALVTADNPANLIQEIHHE